MNTEILDLLQGNQLFHLLLAVSLVAIFFMGIIIYLFVSIRSLKSRYRTMMTGEETGKDFEHMLLQHIASTQAVAAENEKIKDELKRMDALLQRSITRVGVVRFRAFEDMGSDLSYAVALLDSHNNGVVLSSIFGREDSRSYVKPVEGGRSTYMLTAEEQEALRQAAAGAA